MSSILFKIQTNFLGLHKMLVLLELKTSKFDINLYVYHHLLV